MYCFKKKIKKSYEKNKTKLDKMTDKKYIKKFNKKLNELYDNAEDIYQEDLTTEKSCLLYTSPSPRDRG